jgi:nucleoside phosphorylase
MASNHPPTRLEYRIAIICALKLEADQVRAVFDHFWADHPDGDGIIKAHGDTNTYTTGKIGAHNVVLAHMPKYGKGTSASVASNIRHTFPDITLALVAGICGGIPPVFN